MEGTDFSEYTVVIEDGVHFLYYKGEKLPNQVKSVIVQDVESDYWLDSKGHKCKATITVIARLSNENTNKPPKK